MQLIKLISILITKMQAKLSKNTPLKPKNIVISVGATVDDLDARRSIVNASNKGSNVRSFASVKTAKMASMMQMATTLRMET